MQVTRLLTVLSVSFFFSTAAPAQVFDSGPSDPALFTNVINLWRNFSPGSIGGIPGETSQLNVNDGGSIDLFFEAESGSEINIRGGSVGNLFKAREGSELNISSGSLGSSLWTYNGSEVNISGGSVSQLSVFERSVLNISGGTIIRGGIQSGGVLNMSGGSVGGSSAFGVGDGGEATISGGSIGSFRAQEGSDVQLVGGEFKLNGEEFSAATISPGPNDVFTGTLADGSVFIFNEQGGDFLGDVSLTTPSQPLPEASLIPIVVAASTDQLPQGLRQGQHLTVQTGGELGINFAVVDATLNVEGGTVATQLQAAGSVVNISGGSVGRFFDANSGSVVNITGGTVGGNFIANDGSLVNISGGLVDFQFSAKTGSVVNITGGAVGRLFDAEDGSVVTISGGSFEESIWAKSGSLLNISGGSFGPTFRVSGVVNIRGGSFGNDFRSYVGSNVNLFGSEFAIDGVLLDDLVSGEAFTIIDRDGVILSGLLADGSEFSFDLNSDFDSDPDKDQFATGVLTVTLISELLGDCNQDGVVNFLDIGPFISILAAADYLAEADVFGDGVISFLDIQPFIEILSSQ